MSKQKKYKPCSDEGELLGKVSTAEDFKSFCLFMSDRSPGALAIRKKAYERISETGEATSKAKIDFVRACALDYFKHQLKSGNMLSLQALSKDSDDWDVETAERFVFAMGKEFRGLLAAVGGDVFEGMMLASSMTDKARAALVKALWSSDEFVDKIIQKALKSEQGKAAEALKDWRESSEARRVMASRVGLGKEADRSVLDVKKYGIYAPLLKFITEHLGVAQRAEYFARFEDYARSGYLDEDLGLAGGSKMEGLSSTAAVQAWRSLASQVMSGREPQPLASEVRQALHERLAEVGVRMDVGSIKGSRSDGSWKAKPSYLKPEDMDELATRGQVDAFTMTLDKRALVTFASSDPLLKTQNAQWARHFLAVESCLDSMALKSASYRVLAPCMIADKNHRLSANVKGDPIAAWFSGKEPIDPQLHATINAVPFMSELLNGSKAVLAKSENWGVGKWAARLDLDLIGSANNAWPKMQQALREAPNPDVEFNRQMLLTATSLLAGLARGAEIRGERAAKVAGVASVDKAGPEMSLIVKFVNSVAMRCQTEAHPDLLEAVKAAAKKAQSAKQAFDENSEGFIMVNSASALFEASVMSIKKANRADKAAKKASGKIKAP